MARRSRPTVYDEPMADGSERHLRDYAAVLRRRWPIVVVVTAAMAASALLFSLLQDDSYEADARVLLQRGSTDQLFNDNGPSEVVASVETQVEVLESDPVQRAVRRQIGRAPKVTAERVGETEVMEITADDGTARGAAAIANAYAKAYVDYRRSTLIQGLLDAAGEIQARIDALQPQIAALEPRVGESAAARTQYETLLSKQAAFGQKLDEVEVSAALGQGGAQVVKAARVPTEPVSPKPLRNTLAALVLGALIGVGAAFARDHLDDSIKDKDELARATRLPVLGVVPVVKEWDPALSLPDWFRENVHSPATEAYRSLRTSIQLLGIDRPVRSLQVTSPLAGEGKTSTLANLALAMAAAGQRVVVVDCDLRRPRLHEVFHVSASGGMTAVLAGDLRVEDAVRPVPGWDTLHVLGAGSVPANPSELLAARRTAQVIYELQNLYDIVLVDSPPVLPVTDATLLAAWVEVTVLVAGAGTTSARRLAEAVAVLDQVKAPMAGVVLNRAVVESGYGYGYRYEDDGRNGDGAAPVTSRPASVSGQPPPAPS